MLIYQDLIKDHQSAIVKLLQDPHVYIYFDEDPKDDCKHNKIMVVHSMRRGLNNFQHEKPVIYFHCPQLE